MRYSVLNRKLNFGKTLSITCFKIAKFHNYKKIELKK